MGKFPSDSNVRNITHNCEFSNAMLRHATRMLLGINEKTQSHIFTSGPGSLPSVLSRSTWKFMGGFLIATNARQTEPLYAQSACSCWCPGNIYRYVISMKILAWSTNSFEVVLMFKKNVYGRDGGAGVNMCLHHARNRIAVQNNALISIISFTLKQVNWSLSRHSTAGVFPQMVGQSKSIIKISESIYLTVQLRSWYGHYLITPVILKSFLEKQIWLGYIWTLQPIESDSRKSFYA